MAARMVPFGLYASFLLVTQGIAWGVHAGYWPPGIADSWVLWGYPVKTLVVCVALAAYWPQYRELPWPPALSWRTGLLSVAVGVLVYLAWVHMDWPWAMQGERAAGYNPFSVQGGAAYFLVVSRLVGAALAVPVMEELFWRSFLQRYLISSRFETVPLGASRPSPSL